MKILSVVGARPQFIKEAVVQKEISKYSKINEVLVHTGQHYDNNMSSIFFDTLNIKEPNYNLGISGSSHGEMTGRMVIELEKIMIKEKPDLVFLYGDTNSTLAAAISATKLKIKIAHVEAGLRRKFIRDTPEEINRILTDRISDYLFAPSELSVNNLKREGILENVYLSGDVMYDIYLNMKPNFDYSVIDNLKLKKDCYIMMTLHRDFNVDFRENLQKILLDVNKLSKEIQVVFPIHPRTKKRISEFGLENLISNINVIEPVDYLKLMALTENCFKVITDSGGYQKEAYFAGKQAVVLMSESTWRELIECGFNTLCESDEIYNSIMKIKGLEFIEGIYGNGRAAEEIVSIVSKLI